MVLQFMYSAIRVQRIAGIGRSSTLTRRFSKSTTSAVTTPEDIINECSQIRASIQSLNDVRSQDVVALQDNSSDRFLCFHVALQRTFGEVFTEEHGVAFRFLAWKSLFWQIKLCKLHLRQEDSSSWRCSDR